MFDTIIKGGTIVTASNVFKADIGITGGTIAGIGQNLHGHRKIDATGKLVTPGAVDIHVHMQMPLGEGLYSSDSFFTGTRAAAFGGTTTIVDFVDTDADESMLDALAKRRALADPSRKLLQTGMRAERFGRVVVARQFRLTQRCVDFLVADVVEQDGWPTLAAFQLGDQVMQALRHAGWDRSPTQRANRRIAL